MHSKYIYNIWVGRSNMSARTRELSVNVASSFSTFQRWARVESSRVHINVYEGPFLGGYNLLGLGLSRISRAGISVFRKYIYIFKLFRGPRVLVEKAQAPHTFRFAID